MRPFDAGRWWLLAILWSLQYLLMRIAVPVLGAGPVAEGRTLFAAMFLVPWVIFVARESIGLRAHWKDHLAIGLANNVLPFVLLAWSATVLPAGYLAIINGTIPLWTALLAALLLHEPLGWRRAAGFALGIAGVALIVNLGPVTLDPLTVLGAIAGLASAALWGWAGVLIKQRSERVQPMGLAAGSVAFAAVMMAPLLAAAPPPAAWTLEAAAALVALGALCSGLAYVPFFTLVRDIGPSRTLSVGFAVPWLGILWGWLFLDEAVTLPMLAGAALLLIALALVLRR